MLTQSDWISRANAVLPGGGFGNFDPGIIIREGKGSRVWDEDGKEYVDLLIGSGPMLLAMATRKWLTLSCSSCRRA
jgi:glutamate-1-semialdehyde 2,1-aminomutase